jgi:acetoin utilization deacetylase AcuC-like enzyme
MPVGTGGAGGFVEPDEHVESPQSKRRLRNLLDVSGLLDELAPVRPRPATTEELLRLHTRRHIEKIRTLSDTGGGLAGVQTPIGAGSYEAALLAVGGCIEAVDAVLTGRVENAYALVRPPGHHAESDEARGFCFFGNTALAALHAKEVHGLSRIAVVDWDVHHGNGTERAFYEDPGVLTVSLHQDRLFPFDTGAVRDAGAGDGEGYNINVPLPPGSGEGAYLAAFERIVVPALAAYRPELILVASGFDACAMDPLGRMLLHSEAYRKMARFVRESAAEACDGRVVACHEGGYSAAYVPFCGLAVIEELSGLRTGIEDPFMAEFGPLPGQELQPHQETAISEAEKLLTGNLAQTSSKGAGG